MGMKLYYKYEWDDSKKKFLVVKGESAHRSELRRDVRVLINLLVKDIQEKSGLCSKLDIVILLIFFCFFILFFVAGGLLITYNYMTLGLLFLAFTPFISFSMYVTRFVRGSRFQRLQSFIFESDEFYKEMLEPAGLAMSSYFFESRVI